MKTVVKMILPLTSWFLLLVFPIQVLTALSHSVTPFEIGCSNGSDSNQQFPESLNATLSILNAASSTAYFSTATSGKAYAAYLCRYDIPLTTCHECVLNCTTTFPFGPCTDGRVSFGLCTLHYANYPIASRLDPTFTSSWCLDPAPNGPFLDRSVVEGAAVGLIDRATANATAGRNYYFATGEEVERSFNRTVYGMVQCAPDINATDCRHCLNLTVGNGLIECGVSAGIYSYTGSCSVSLSVYAFYKTSSNSSVTPRPISRGLLPSSSTPKLLGPVTFINTAVLMLLLLAMEMAQG